MTIISIDVTMRSMVWASIETADSTESSIASRDMAQAWESAGTYESDLGTATVSVIVPVYNGGYAFRRCLASLAKLRPSPLEIIVVVDGDTQGSAALASEFGIDAIVLPTRGGPARARNTGAARARGDIVLFIDADVECPVDTVGRVAETFRDNPSLAAILGSYDDAPAAGGFLSQYKNLFHHYVHQNANEEAFTFWGACGAVRRETFAAVGGFSETYTNASIEDIELGGRLREAGYSVRLCKQLQVKHLKAWSALSLVKTDFLYRALPWSALILRNRLAANDLNLRTASRVSLVAVYAMAAAIVAIAWRPLFASAAAGAFAIALLAINAPVYGFFARKRGVWFALKVVPWHWLYYLYGGMAFAISLAGHLLGTARRVRTNQTPVRVGAQSYRN